ncbi:MAG: FG-GAP-like repeat-containing protein [Planctomycetes bacterium]|nr:FG-GAP-like repeat-containing protein [Planctomycetota bacterium]
MKGTKTPLLSLLAGLSIAASASAQQFQYQPGMIPGTPRWSEGVEACDVDLDGDLDLFFADGDGFSSPGTQRQNVLVINQLIETGFIGFTDESLARLGARTSNAKGVSCADVDGDGWPDALYANGFNTDPPFLYMNRGVTQAGYFDEEGNARGLTTNLNSAAGQFGDLDDDGDLDLILCDAGPSLLSAPGGKPRLYRNNGFGHFTEDAAALNAPTKRAHMDVQLVDVDGDWDLDFVGLCRSGNVGGNHYLMLNDGVGHFTDASNLIPSGSASTYEGEVADLDGDKDLDLFLVSLSGYQEGAVRNDLVPTGSLGFTNQGPLQGSYDDNEIALCDYDNDGDFDAFVGSLSNRERLWRNDGGLSFTNQHAQIQAVSDSTLDCTFADIDNDGDYDLITAQGESNPAQYVNKVYENTGAADTLAPEIVSVREAELSGAWYIRAKVSDQVLDDGVDYVTGRCVYVPYAPADGIYVVSVTDTDFSPASLTIHVGETVAFENTTSSWQAVEGTTAPYLFSSDVIQPSNMWHRNFVSPGTYAYTNPLNGATGEIVVVGVVEEVAGFKSGGGQHRFIVPTSAGLTYELLFTDYQGNVSASDAYGAGGMPFPSFCFGDGTGAPCPCGNIGGPGRGCANNGPFMQGALMQASGSQSVSADSLLLATLNLVPNQPGLYFQGNNAVAGGLGTAFGDGLRCVGGGVVRLEVAFADAGGVSFTTVGIASKGGVQAGDVKRYQLWYRSPGPTSACGFTFNLTNGVEVWWGP